MTARLAGFPAVQGPSQRRRLANGTSAAKRKRDSPRDGPSRMT
jgi:hypothetical protein